MQLLSDPLSLVHIYVFHGGGQMKKSLRIMALSGILAASPVSVDQQEPAKMKICISCPDPRGFPAVPECYEADKLPAISEDCTLLIYIATRNTLENAIRNLRGLVGAEE
jgi:hypothetical protein